MMARKRKKRSLPWVTDEWLARMDAVVAGLAPTGQYFLADIINQLDIPGASFNNASKGCKSRKMVVKDGRNHVVLSGMDMKGLLVAYHAKKPRPRTEQNTLQKLLSGVERSGTVEKPTPSTSEMLRIYDRLIGVLETLPEEAAREMAFRLAERYSRSKKTVERLNSGEEVSTPDEMGATVEKPTA